MRDMYDELFGYGSRDDELEPDYDAWEDEPVDEEEDPFADFEEEE